MTTLRSKLLSAVLSLLLVLALTASLMFAAGVLPVVLWTDALIFALLAFIILTIVYGANTPHWRTPWQKVKQRRAGMAAAVILVCFALVALLDSIHFRLPVTGDAQATTFGRYQPETLSILDVLGTRLRTQVETSYSAPFAWTGYVKETFEKADGTTVRDFPRLRYAAAHLTDPAQQRWPDVFTSIGVGLVLAGAMTFILFLIVAVFTARANKVAVRHEIACILRGRSQTPWRVILITLGTIMGFVVCVVLLAPKYHVLGTDKIGQDVLWQAIKSIRTGLVIGTLTTLIMLPFAVLLGVMAGYFRGWIDDVVQYTYTTLNSIPSVLLVAAAVLMVQLYIDSRQEVFDSAQRADLRLLFLCMILGVTSWTGLCRYLRAETLKLRESDYVQAAQALGVSHFRILIRHIVPNVMHIVLITVVLDFSGLVLAEAVLSYVGVGVDPAMDSWGNMINRARLEMAREPMVWWSLLGAFSFMFVLVLAANLFADAVRDAYDPRSRV